MAKRSQTNNTPVRFVAIVGGSGAGKTWLAERLQAQLGGRACRISLDDFYRDRSHLPQRTRKRINFDNPRAIDWPKVHEVINRISTGKTATVPCYDFKTHGRKPVGRKIRPPAIIIMDGLWLLRRPALRSLFSYKIFLECPMQLRLSRRLQRDGTERGRNSASVCRQFRETVAPMHERFVAPQTKWANVVLKRPVTHRDVVRLARELQALLITPHL